jgi:PucR family transcriptional regulator, purine catabolism regulatory protein
VNAARKTPARSAEPRAPAEEPGATLDALAEAVESGAGLPSVARAAAAVLSASVALIDRSSAVLAVAAASPAEEGKLLSGGEGVTSVELRVADALVGHLRYRPRGKKPSDPTMARMVSTLLALELERSRSPEWASEEAAGGLVRAVLEREVTDRGDIIARAAELGAELEAGAGVVIARVSPRSAQSEDWRARALTLAIRGLRAVSSGSLASDLDGESAEIAAIVPAADEDHLTRSARALEGELAEGLAGFMVHVARSRHAADPVDLYRAGCEARLAINVGEAEGRSPLAFEDTGAYRLLLPAMSEDPAELEQFYGETVQPLAAYDEQYETELLATVEAYLDNDGNVAATAQQLFTHRHTIRYRLERARDLCGHDVASTEGREKLGLGLKAMRVLGISPPRGPAKEPGTEAGKVSRAHE